MNNANTTCLRCGSEKSIDRVPLLDYFGDAGILQRQASVNVQGAPEALLFKDISSGKLSVQICGDCGHAELWVSDFRELYEKYEKSRQQ